MLDGKTALHGPLYMACAEDIKKTIYAGVYGEGEQLPSEQELCETYGMSRTTIRKALKVLSDQNIIKTVRGSGSFVAPGAFSSASPNKSARLTTDRFEGITPYIKSLGSTPSLQPLDFSPVEPEGEIAEFFAPWIAEGYGVLRLLLVRLINNDPMMVESIYIPSVYGDFTRQDLTESFYATMSSLFNVSPGEGTKSVGLSVADSQVAFLLGVEEGHPLLCIDDKVFDTTGKPFHISHELCLGEKYHIMLDLSTFAYHQPHVQNSPSQQ